MLAAVELVLAEVAADVVLAVYSSRSYANSSSIFYYSLAMLVSCSNWNKNLAIAYFRLTYANVRSPAWTDMRRRKECSFAHELLAFLVALRSCLRQLHDDDLCEFCCLANLSSKKRANEKEAIVFGILTLQL
jgi:hypothetical protein